MERSKIDDDGYRRSSSNSKPLGPKLVFAPTRWPSHPQFEVDFIVNNDDLILSVWFQDDNDSSQEGDKSRKFQ